MLDACRERSGQDEHHGQSYAKHGRQPNTRGLGSTARHLIAVCLAIAMIASKAGANAQVAFSESSEKVLSVGEAPRVSLTHVTGNVVIRGEDSPTLVVKVTKRVMAGDEEAAQALMRRVVVDVKGEVGEATLLISHGACSSWEQLKAMARKGQLEDVKVDIDITLPRRSVIDLSTVSGEVSLTGVEGGMTINGVSAPVVMERVAGGCRVATISGNLTVAGIAGGLAVQTVTGVISGTTVRGSCVIDTVSGAVSLQFDPRGSGIARINTISGAVALVVPPERAGMVDLQTASGTLQTDLTRESPKEGKLRLQVGSGGLDVAVRTVSGAIDVKKRR